MLRKFLISCLCALTLSVGTQTAQAIPATSTPLEGSQIGIAYRFSPQGKIHGINQELFFHPASTQKMVTALAAMIFLGGDYELITRLEVNRNVMNNDKLVVDSSGTLNSDVVVRFTGDPTMRVDHYQSLLSILQKHGVRRINGKVLLDVSRFGGPSRANGWSWDDLPSCFTAPSAPIIINRNCTFAQLKSDGPGTHASPLVPSGVPIELQSDVVAVEEGHYGGDCILEANLFIDNKYHLTGCIPASSDPRKLRPWPLSLAISDAERWGKDWTATIMRRLNIKVRDGIEITRTPVANMVTIAQRNSPKMRELVEYMLQKSNNLYADTIAKNVAAEYFNLPATYYRANRAMRSILNQYAKIDLGNSYIVDGSGLSPHNLMSPATMLEILDYINKHNDKLGIIELMPVSGKSGTLQWRASTFNAPLKGHVIAKTGTLQNVSNLAGFVITKSGNRVPFVMFTNSITYSERTRDLVKYRRSPSPHYSYERYIIEHIYDEDVMGRDFR
ncbi:MULTISPECIES: D-alanyl-D-alanine carboxypeptidase/D-alanyl-D-alanine-endopeptidase [unclassified Anaerobiospirillum]|uniref:D-alanyl-D-alanine carboxypeptidase/D-alanyl-D-alanine endopeptidase n=1 Tax=unclassified Anaerobiospirillum TaxID=2647410 RepID=UPI001FF68C58|nr:MULTISPECIES: D-alanyl-D-alanine carboxypeptidase/D-alanyl-D-alanine-endopeptidase [unclassified Anaerobiospirillum]MCK0534518.1 D-alanyl-D-alanine carboxypeptidase/D-alanyl-D-alanine-endopeptidase [Anaerobiospirillum sp. NML120511]MCK0539820.1 D-alanyl-D-alanine carboxypeptidase/D-alanyl-D-alanine-endopeptidase [Anaerobiospirillum sp. NML02-A-032]